MAGERGPTKGGADQRVPEADPSCAACSRLWEFLRMVIALLGRMQQERGRDKQRIGELEPQIEELKREQFGIKSEVQAKPPGGAARKGAAGGSGAVPSGGGRADPGEAGGEAEAAARAARVARGGTPVPAVRAAVPHGRLRAQRAVRNRLRRVAAASVLRPPPAADHGRPRRPPRAPD